MKRILTVFFAVCIFSALFIFSASASADDFSVSDARKVLVAIGSKSDLTEFSEYDLDENGIVSVSDVRIMLILIANGYSNTNQKYTVSFQSGGGVGEMDSLTATCGLYLTIPENKFTNSDLVFAGWNVIRNSDGYIYCKSPSSFGWFAPENIPSDYNIVEYKDKDTALILTQDGDSISLVATWMKVYYVSFNSNGGEGTMNTQTAYYGEINCLNKNTFTKYGHDFEGWYAHRASDDKWYYYNGKDSAGWYIEGNQPDGYSKYLYKDGTSVSKTSSVTGDNVTMYAVWKKYYYVSFNSNGGDGKMNSQTAYYGETNYLNKNTFTKYGHDFDGWYAHRASDDKWYYYNGKDGAGWYIEGNQPDGYSKYLYKNGTAVSKTSSVAGDNVTMYAVWKKYYTVQFNSNGGVGTMNSQKVYYGIGTPLNKNKFTRSYKTFGGWYAKRLSDNKWYYYNKSTGAAGWYISGTQPSGYTLWPYADGSSVARTSSVAGDTVTMYAIWNTPFRKEVYGKSYQGRELYAYIFNDTQYATKTLFIDFAVHGFEDEYYRDGQVLVDCALKIAEYYMNDCSELGKYRLVLVPCANPDGTYAGVNDLRACSTAFGRCTAAHIDMNRDFGTFAAQESRYLRDLIKKYSPDVYVNCHGWLDMVLGNTEVGSIFVNEYNLTTKKYGSYGLSQGYIIGWVKENIGAKSVLLEYKNSSSTDYKKMIKCINKIAATVS